MTHPATYKDCSSEVALELIMGGFGYQVRIKPALKLIDWSKMPAGTMTNHGELLEVNSLTQSAITLVGCDTEYWKLNNLRLAEQTKFTYWGGGDCPVPDSTTFEVVLRTGDKQKAVFQSQWQHKCNDQDQVIAYRITSLADGWTDDPSNAAA
jgi:hypothetical protein